MAAPTTVAANGKILKDFDPPAKPKRNNFAFVCATVASMTSVLLGYEQFILVATFLLDRVGRRPLLLGSFAGMITSLATLGMCLTVIGQDPTKRIKWAVWLCITTVLSAVACFSIGAGPVTGVYSTEIFPLRLRAQGMSLGIATNRVVSGVITMTFLSLYEAITIGGAFFLFAGISTVGFFFFYLFYPETQGKTLEEIEGLFGNFIHWRSANLKKSGNINNTEKDVQLAEKN